MKQVIINVEGVPIDSKVLGHLIICGIVKSQIVADNPNTPNKRKSFLLSCVEKGTELLNRLDEVNNPKL